VYLSVYRPARDELRAADEPRREPTDEP